MKFTPRKHFSWLPITAHLIASLAGQKQAFAQHFTLPVLPDTQVEVRVKPNMFLSQLNWIAQNKKALRMPMVLHVGDIVDFDNVRQWETASRGFEILDRKRIPYALAVGNHDTAAVGRNSGSAAPGNVNLNLRNTLKFNYFFPVSRLRAQKGRFEEGKSDNAFYTFKAGGLDWLVLSLEFCARPGPVDWANEVVAAHPKANVIVLTHFHLNGKGEINPNNAGYGDLTTQAVYDRFIKKHANIVLVLSGHTGSSAHRTDTGESGNTIYQILQDYQHEDAGGGYIRLLDIDTQKGTIAARMYSPFYQKTKEDYSKFSISGIKFIR